MSDQKGSSFVLAEKIALKAAEMSMEAPQRFMSIYERLKALQIRELEPLMYILDKVHSDPQVAVALDARPKLAENRTPRHNATRSFSSSVTVRFD